MPFIGTQPEVGGYSVLDALTASATASYTLQLNSANFVPSSANQLLVSLNGVIQKPGSSFTVSGSTLTFSSALDSSDSIDFIMAMGEPLLIGTPSDGTVDANKLATNAVTSAKIATNAVTTAKITDANITTAKLTGETIIQMKTAVDTTIRGTTSTTFVVASNTAQVTITPRSTSSRIFVTCSGGAGCTDGNDGWFTTIFRDSTNLGDANGGLANGNSVPAVIPIFFPFCMTVLDSPNTTSAITYGLRFKNYNVDGDGYAETKIGRDIGGTSNPCPTHITVMELAG